MRQIKFRAWFKKDQEMKEVAMNNVYTVNKGHLYLSPLPMSNYKEIELMQWTGLNDKKGKEIYEGDIFEVEFVEDRYNEWSGHSTELVKVRKSVYFENGTFKLDGFELFRVLSNNGEVEVIGNIYENPELVDA